MKCEVCLELLEEYVDGELPAPEQAHVNEHLIACTECAASFASLTAEQQLFARYDREVEISPFLWTRIAAHTVSQSNAAKAGWRRWLRAIFLTPSAVVAIALVLFSLVVLLGLSLGGGSQLQQLAKGDPQPVNTPKVDTPRINEEAPPAIPPDDITPKEVASQPKPKRRARPAVDDIIPDQSDVLSSELGYLDMDERDTARHIEQTQNLLRSIKNVQIAEGDDEIDVTYDKALSRRLLNENVVLRRDAEMKAKFPTKTLLTDLEPFLIDIANLPDRARAEDVRVIKERVQKTEIVAALVDYQDRGTNNR